MGLFDDIVNGVVRPVVDVVGGTTRLTARAVAAALAVPIALVEEAYAAGCETVDEVREFIRTE